MDDLVQATGLNRQAIYARVGGKQELYRRGFAAYRDSIVDPAFARVEAPDATLQSIAAYFEHQIALAEAAGLPGPGCFVANAMTETAPHEPEIADEVAAHNDRLKAGFVHALKNDCPTLPAARLSELADFLVVTAQGLWSLSRSVTTAQPLRDHVKTVLTLLRGEFTR